MCAVVRHQSVLHSTVLELLRPLPGETVLDATLGLGGHAASFAEAIGEGGRLIGLDADAENLALARERLAHVPCSMDLRHVNFSQLPALALPPVDILFADLGLSSPHLDDPARGFSFRNDGPLDLRFDRTRGETARELLRRIDADTLAHLLRRYGEMKGAFRLATAIAGRDVPTTAGLRAIVEAVFGFRAPSLLPQIFQAIRIAVNDELGALETLLEAGPRLLAPGGRMGVISFHSLEDRLVKHVFRALCTPRRDALTGQISHPAAYTLLTPKPVVPSTEEISSNPRARSAKLRIIHRCHPPS